MLTKKIDIKWHQKQVNATLVPLVIYTGSVPASIAKPLFSYSSAFGRLHPSPYLASSYLAAAGPLRIRLGSCLPFLPFLAAAFPSCQAATCPYSACPSQAYPHEAAACPFLPYRPCLATTFLPYPAATCPFLPYRATACQAAVAAACHLVVAVAIEHHLLHLCP